MELHRRLSIVDRVAKWGIVVQQECVICDTQLEEKFDHIFFACPYSKHVWSSLLNWLGYSRTIGDWNHEIQWLIQRMGNSRPRASILGFCFAVAVYHIWAERNGRRFSHQVMSSLARLKDIYIQLHLEGQRHSKWKSHLEQLNSYPC
ncbi:uncharacterized protein LOC132637417 [Lycium barbarum]|uniref:uncharacterized protein LOC132637417 n=1 Tax=Lycium barbarum TaxID=112863 RepID=UPI00293E85B3|nr:uncharacterized protein LOC132637417 [Lycium barbarum]